MNLYIQKEVSRNKNRKRSSPRSIAALNSNTGEIALLQKSENKIHSIDFFTGLDRLSEFYSNINKSSVRQKYHQHRILEATLSLLCSIINSEQHQTRTRSDTGTPFFPLLPIFLLFPSLLHSFSISFSQPFSIPIT